MAIGRGGGVETRVEWEADKWINVFLYLVWLVVIDPAVLIQPIRFSKQRKNVHSFICLLLFLSTTAIGSPFYAEFRFFLECHRDITSSLLFIIYFLSQIFRQRWHWIRGASRWESEHASMGAFVYAVASASFCFLI